MKKTTFLGKIIGAWKVNSFAKMNVLMKPFDRSMSVFALLNDN